MHKGFHKGQKLSVKAPPYYEKEYVYEITSAGEKLVRASLLNSPTVRKSWSVQELETMIKMKVARVLEQEDESHPCS